jgi:hypothetical protein
MIMGIFLDIYGNSKLGFFELVGLWVAVDEVARLVLLLP